MFLRKHIISEALPESQQFLSVTTRQTHWTSCCLWRHWTLIYRKFHNMSVVVNFDALAQANNIRIEWDKLSYPVHTSWHYWSLVRGIHRSPVDAPHQGPVMRTSLILGGTSRRTNSRVTGDLRRLDAHMMCLVGFVCCGYVIGFN